MSLGVGCAVRECFCDSFTSNWRRCRFVAGSQRECSNEAGRHENGSDTARLERTAENEIASGRSALLAVNSRVSCPHPGHGDVRRMFVPASPLSWA